MIAAIVVQQELCNPMLALDVARIHRNQACSWPHHPAGEL
jgi:hypothetical protein